MIGDGCRRIQLLLVARHREMIVTSPCAPYTALAAFDARANAALVEKVAVSA